jgi:molybdopterin-synthase adenylyltransferase
MSPDDTVRYARQISLPQIGTEGQKKLINSSVLIVGTGGLGAPLALYLAGAGVGRIGLADGDRVALSNLPRQILYETADIGRLKVEAAADALRDRNPELRLELHSVRLEEGNAREIIKNYDLVADGSDNFATRLLVNATCYQLQKTLVSAAVMGWRGQISTFKPHLGGPCYQCLIGSENPEDANCATAGVMGSVAGMMACWQATEVIKELLEAGESLLGTILHYDALQFSYKKSTLRKDKLCSVCGKH